MMSSFSDTLEDAFRRAFTVQDPEALKRTVRILEEGYDPVRRLESDVTGLKSDVRIIAERMEQGFARMDERFEAMERLNTARFDAVDKRFESMESANTARFEAIGKQFESVDHRLESVDRRFESVDRRFAQQNRMMFAGFTVLAVLMSIYEFVA
jgi:flagellar capping protein FliD